MKKLTAILLVAVMVLSLTVYTSAVFVESPSYTQDPTVVEIVPSGDDEHEIVVTPYSKRKQNMLYDDIKELERAYNSINYAKTVADLHPSLSNDAAELGTSVKNLSVSTLFDVTCLKHDVCPGPVTISLQSDSFKGFVKLLHYKNRAWEVVDNASVSGNVLTFTADNFSPFAVVVATSKNADGSVTVVETPQEAACAQVEVEVVND